MIFLDGQKAYVQSSAAVQIARRMRWPWRLGFVFLLVPGPLRDALYKLVAKYRYRWFGNRARSLVPSQDTLERFLE